MARAARLYLTLLYLFIGVVIPAAVALYVPSLPATGDDPWAVAVAKGTNLFQQLENSTPWTDVTRFYNEYSPLNGLIAALETIKSPAETLHWSDIAFAMWEAVSSFSGQSPEDLRFIAQHSIRHPFTQSIITRLFEKRVGAIRIYARGSDDYLALLGTPSGAGAVYLLMQHKRQLGQKMIVKATVFGKTRSQWALHGPDVVFEVRDVADAGKRGGGASSNAISRERWAGLCQSLNSSKSDAISQL
ncbi:MAG: hypothetical protein Q9210_003725 [Variospora velana]